MEDTVPCNNVIFDDTFVTQIVFVASVEIVVGVAASTELTTIVLET